VTSVGYDPRGREVDDATVADSMVVVESRAAVLTPVPAGSNDPRSNDLLQPIARGVIAAEDVTEIGELVAGSKPGRTSSEQITLYKSVGVAVQDGVAAALVLRTARERGAGREVEL
jgi:ornithine cyclodeaminase/alanine dehydrogenase-like protein (mu-crystallin family)